MTKKRDEVKNEDKWNVEALFKTPNEWQEAFSAIADKKPLFENAIFFKGKLKEDPETFKNAFETVLDLSRVLSKLYTYAHLRHDEDIANDAFKVAFVQISSLMHAFAEAISWFEPEIIAMDEAVLNEIVNSPLLKPYRFAIEKIARIKKHTLPEEQEQLLAIAGKALETPHHAFSALNDADFKFEDAIDSKGNKKPLTHALFGLYLRDQDRTLRKSAFQNVLQKYEGFENTLTEILNGQVQAHWLNARARHYSSSLEASLFPKNIEPEVYHSLIDAVNSKLPVLHNYFKLREKILGIGKLHIYDTQVPLTKDLDIKMDYSEAEDIIIESVLPLGTDYQNKLKDGLKNKRWADRYENQNKRSGAYSSGCFDSEPYILMNYKGILRDVFTLAHEAGHSMHSLLSRKNQPYHYSDYPIFLAEVASTFNEELLMQTLLKRFTKKEEQIFLINQKIEDIRATLFRQTCFAEFELFIHQMAEQNIPLTPKLLKEEYRKLTAKYYGDFVTLDPEIDIEFARIPHFYYNFYVYQYATGISAALSLAEKVLKGGEKERDAYLSFLKAGSSDYPIEILKKAGVDMRSKEPVNSAIEKFEGLVKKLEALHI
ncbi:MAG TPA: oligoendopeptidase F [Parachlamydiaceae bacterium]|nr:oligoendopeptidase F [Parachlamydiaceae bacterium]